MTNSADPDQLAEANWSGFSLFAKTGHVVFSKRRVIRVYKYGDSEKRCNLSTMRIIKLSVSVRRVNICRYFKFFFFCFFFIVFFFLIDARLYYEPQHEKTYLLTWARPRLIWIFAGHTYPKVHYLTLRLLYFCQFNADLGLVVQSIVSLRSSLLTNALNSCS